MSKTRPRLETLVAACKSAARSGGGAVWRDVAERLEKPRRTHAEVNLSRIERYAQDSETVVVPGKVLGGGQLAKDVTVAAVDFSSGAERKIDAAGAEAVRLDEAVAANPEGENVRVMR